MPQLKKEPAAASFRVFRDAVYAKLVRQMRRRNSRQLFQSLVDAGIYTKAGRLTKPYRELQAD